MDKPSVEALHNLASDAPTLLSGVAPTAPAISRFLKRQVEARPKFDDAQGVPTSQARCELGHTSLGLGEHLMGTSSYCLQKVYEGNN